MVKKDSSPQIIEMVGRYLRAQNTKTIMDLFTDPRTHDTKGIG